MPTLDAIDEWGADHAAAAVIPIDGDPILHGATDHPFALASVTKILVALSVLVAEEEGSIGLDDPAGPPGATIRHLLAHASGLGPDRDTVLAPPATRRIYSNRGFEVIGAALATATGMSVGKYVTEALGLRATTIDGSPASGAVGSLRDLVHVAQELLAPTRVASETLDLATQVAFPGLDGVLPGFGRQSPNDWGLGFELRGAKQPHWTGAANSPRTFGHFGQSGTMMWVDPVAGIALVCLTDRNFDDWATRAWPALSDTVLAQSSDRSMKP